jgi:hypothetical protein
MEGRHALIRLEITQKGGGGDLYSALLVSPTSSSYCLGLIPLPGHFGCAHMRRIKECSL